MVSTFYTPPNISSDEAFPMKGIVARLLKQQQQQQENQARDINLKYMEPGLIESLKASKLKNQYYGPNMESQIGLRGAQAGHLGAQTRGLDIENKYRPKTLSDAEQKRKIELDYPGFNSTGITGELARYHYMKDHGLLPGIHQGQQGGGMPIPPPGYQGGQGMPGGVMRQQGMPQPGQDMQNPGADYISQLMASQGQQGQSGMGTQMPPGMQDQGRAPQGMGMQGNPSMQDQGMPMPNQQPEQTHPEMMMEQQDPILNAILKMNKKGSQHGAYGKALEDVEEAKIKYGTDSKEFKNATDYANRIAKGGNEYQQKRADSYAWSTAPVDAKNYMLAQAAGMGINPDKAINAFSKGKSIEDLATESGFDPNNLPDPDFMPTSSNRSKLKERQAGLNELNVLSEFTTKALKPYSKTILGYSPTQTMDALRNKNVDQQAEFFAARGLAQEQNLIRLAVANARGTIPAIRSLTEKSMNDIKAFRPLVSNEVWAKTQKIMDDKLGEALNAAAKAYKLKGKNKVSEALEKPDFSQMSDEELKKYIGE